MDYIEIFFWLVISSTTEFIFKVYELCVDNQFIHPYLHRGLMKYNIHCKLCRCARLTLLRSCLQHFRSRYEHPEEVNQANGEHHNRVNPRRSKLGIAENGEFKEQPDERQNDNWPLPGSQAKSMRLR